jgi:hypothetical protein
MSATKGQTPLLLGIHSILWAALAGDAALLATDSILTGLFTGQSVWRPYWVLGSAFRGQVVLHWPMVFDLSPITAAATALFPFCCCYTLILACAVLPWNMNRPALAGAALGALCYLPSLYGLSLWCPWLMAERGWIFLASHVAFGLVATFVLLHRARNNFD